MAMQSSISSKARTISFALLLLTAGCSGSQNRIHGGQQTLAATHQAVGTAASTGGTDSGWWPKQQPVAKSTRRCSYRCGSSVNATGAAHPRAASSPAQTGGTSPSTTGARRRAQTGGTSAHTTGGTTAIGGKGSLEANHNGGATRAAGPVP